ncbi:MAG: hypothetical protein HWN67_12245 [Candidatus Helarchaeota archaeon]|nr:hypothetical protein [Candidatus Helarchaeota archaeon]
MSEIVKQAQKINSKIYNNIDNLQFKVHSKTFIYFGFSPLRVNLVPYFEEYYADGYWEKPDSVKLNIYAIRVVESGRDSSLARSINKQFSLPGPFIFDYNILTSKRDKEFKRPYYPFAEGSEKYYEYKLIGTLKSGMMDVIEVQVIPKFIDVPAVEGTFLLDKSDSWIVASDFIYNDAAKLTVQADKKGNIRQIKFVTDEEHRINIKKSFYYSSFWLPEVMEEEFFVSIIGFKVKVHRIIEFDSYIVNTPKFKTIKPSKKINYSIDYQKQDSILSIPKYPDRLSKEEEERIIEKIEDKIRSVKLFEELEDLSEIAKKTAKESIKKKGGKVFKYGVRASSLFQYNRIEALHVGYKYKFAPARIKNFASSIEAGYGFEDKKFKGEITFLKLFGKKKKFFVNSKIFDKLGFEEDTNNISNVKNTFSSLIFKADYRDFYRKNGVSLGLGYKFIDNLGAKISFISQEEKRVEKNTDFSIFRRKHPFRVNPEILDGKYNGLELSFKYNTYRINAGSSIKYTDKEFLKSDFSYTLYRFWFDWNYRTTYFSRLFYHFNSGFSSGAVAPQRWFDFGGKVFGNYTGRLRGISYKYFTGDRFISSVLEYHLNGRVLKRIGMKRNFLTVIKFIFFQGVGWSELSGKSRRLAENLNVPTLTTDGVYFEAGIGISDILNICRLDFIHNNIDNRILVQFNILR